MNVALNGSKKINKSRGDYLVLADYGQEGIGVLRQEDTLQNAIEGMLEYPTDYPMSIVKLIRIDLPQDETCS